MQKLLLLSALLCFHISTAHKSSDCLRPGSPESVGLLSQPLRLAVANLTNYTHPANYGTFTHDVVHPIYPGCVNLIGHHSTIVAHFAIGARNLYSNANGSLLPAAQQEPTTLDTIYDLASLTKLYTTIAVLRQVDTRNLTLNATVASYVPDFRANGKANVTILELLTHTSGFAPDPDPALYNTTAYPTYAQRIAAIVGAPLQNVSGTAYTYSDLNFMSLFVVLEAVTGRKLDVLIGEFTQPLGMNSTFFNRGNVEGVAFPYYHRMATQEFQIAVQGPSVPVRPQPVRGTVHDENAYALEGVSGHAGLFSTAGDTAVLCQMILNNGTYAGKRYLSQQSVDWIFTNFNARFPGDEHGLGFELDQYYWAGPMASLQTAGHTGFTGTTLFIDRPSNTFSLHFANRVHPSRNWSSNSIAREATGYWVAKSLGRNVVLS